MGSSMTTLAQTSQGDSAWEEHDNDLRLSDDDANDDFVESVTLSSSGGGASLLVPDYSLKTQGSVVDMLMTGPSPKTSPTKMAITVTSDTREAASATDTRFSESNTVDVHRPEQAKDSKMVEVSLSSESFVFDEESQTFTVSLSQCELVSHFSGRLTFKIKAARVNQGKSGTPEKAMDDQYIEDSL